MAWWDEDITDLIRSLSTFAPYGSTITIVSPEEPKVPTNPAHRALLQPVLLCQNG